MAKTPKKLSPEEKAQRSLQRRHRREVRTTFTSAGFVRSETASDKQFTYDGTTSDFDDVFVMENIVVFIEYTTTKESGISSHIKPKKILYDKIFQDPGAFVTFASGAPLNIAPVVSSKYVPAKLRVVIVYCSLNTVGSTVKADVPNVVYMDYSYVRYFKALTTAIRLSSRWELLDFLGVEFSQFGEQLLKSGSPSHDRFPGSVLPEPHSNLPSGYKVASFYASPASLLERAYVLRHEGWRDRGGLYQRMISRPKLKAIRRHLYEHERVFVNDVVVTLPASSKVLDEKEDTVPTSKITETTAAEISLPKEFNSIGVVDGQHRIYAYHEGGANDDKIANLREQQNLLVTGIIYPEGVTSLDKSRFEAGLFLEINSNQTSAKSGLRQAIGQILRPFATDSLARDVLDRMNAGPGPVAGQFEVNFFEQDRLRTTSVVSYGLRPLVRVSGSGSIMKLWEDDAKDTFIEAEDDTARLRYVAFAAKSVNAFLSAAKARLPSSHWTTDPKNPDRLLTPTVIIGLIGAMRQAIEQNKNVDFESAYERLEGLQSFELKKYKSSQYTVMATDIFRRFFA